MKLIALILFFLMSSFAFAVSWGPADLDANVDVDGQIEFIVARQSSHFKIFSIQVHELGATSSEIKTIWHTAATSPEEALNKRKFKHGEQMLNYEDVIPFQELELNRAYLVFLNHAGTLNGYYGAQKAAMVFMIKEKSNGKLFLLKTCRFKNMNICHNHF